MSEGEGVTVEIKKGQTEERGTAQLVCYTPINKYTKVNLQKRF